MASDARLTAGELNAAFARSVVRLRRQYAGRGPTRIHTFFHDDVVVVIMRDVMTQAEQSLAANGRPDVVRRLHAELRLAMQKDLVDSIEQLTGFNVIASLGDSHVDPDLAAELFVLDGAVPCADTPDA
jgi:uncharacterized protein YbcI